MRTDAERERLLAAAAGDGDDRAFAELVERHREALVRSVSCRSGRAELAEDAVQDALVSAHRALRAGQRPADVRAWLHTIAWHRTLDLVRRERDTVPLESAAVLSPDAGPEQAVERAGELERLVGHWAALPGRQRDALALSVLEGRSTHEIAQLLGVGDTAAKSLVARGRRTLLARLAATEMSCDTARPQVLAAAEDGVRLRGDVHRHVRTCGSCARLHRTARVRRRARAVVLLPVGLLERCRDLVYVTTTHEPQVSLVTKLCATACAATLAGGAGSATVVVTAPPRPLITTLDLQEPPPTRRKAPRAPRREPRPAAMAAVAQPAATPTPSPRPTAAAPPTARVVPSTAVATTQVGSIRPRRPASSPQPAAATTDPSAPRVVHGVVKRPMGTAPTARTDLGTPAAGS